MNMKQKDVFFVTDDNDIITDFVIKRPRGYSENDYGATIS